MAKRLIWTIRIVIRHSDRMNAFPGLWIEQFRRAGYLKILHENDERIILEMICPHHREPTLPWAEMNAERMKSFGINAAATPQWKGEQL